MVLSARARVRVGASSERDQEKRERLGVANPEKLEMAPSDLDGGWREGSGAPHKIKLILFPGLPTALPTRGGEGSGVHEFPRQWRDPLGS